jgi:hypothetical protein
MLSLYFVQTVLIRPVSTAQMSQVRLSDRLIRRWQLFAVGFLLLITDQRFDGSQCGMNRQFATTISSLDIFARFHVLRTLGC